MIVDAIRKFRIALADKSTRAATAHITRLTATATFAYLLALLIPIGTGRPVLAPLTALLVLQASLYQTIRSGIRKVLSVTVGVLVAVVASEFIGFSWWLLALLIATALLIGRMLRLGDDLLEVPISAMLIFSSIGMHAAAVGRVTDTLAGTAAGLAGGLAFAPPRVQPAREAVGELAGRLAGLLDRMAAGLRDNPDSAVIAEWLAQSRSLRGEIERVDDALRTAADSARLNPRALVAAESLPVTDMTVSLRGGLETLEHAALTVRGLARSVLDAVASDSCDSPVHDPATRKRLADVLTQLSAVIRTYDRLLQTMPEGSDSLESELAAQLAETRRLQDGLAEVLEPRAHPLADPDADPDADADPEQDGGAASEWPLRGEILLHVDRLRTGLTANSIPRQRRQPRPRAKVRVRVRPLRLGAPKRLRPPGQLLAQTRRLRRSALKRSALRRSAPARAGKKGAWTRR
jgi:hypothetical protein